MVYGWMACNVVCVDVGEGDGEGVRVDGRTVGVEKARVGAAAEGSEGEAQAVNINSRIQINRLSIVHNYTVCYICVI